MHQITILRMCVRAHYIYIYIYTHTHTHTFRHGLPLLSPHLRISHVTSDISRFLCLFKELFNDAANGGDGLERWRTAAHIYIYIFIYLLQLGCYPVAVVILRVNKT